MCVCTKQQISADFRKKVHFKFTNILLQAFQECSTSLQMGQFKCGSLKTIQIGEPWCSTYQGFRQIGTCGLTANVTF